MRWELLEGERRRHQCSLLVHTCPPSDTPQVIFLKNVKLASTVLIPSIGTHMLCLDFWSHQKISLNCSKGSSMETRWRSLSWGPERHYTFRYFQPPFFADILKYPFRETSPTPWWILMKTSRSQKTISCQTALMTGCMGELFNLKNAIELIWSFKLELWLEQTFLSELNKELGWKRYFGSQCTSGEIPGPSRKSLSLSLQSIGCWGAISSEKNESASGGDDEQISGGLHGEETVAAISRDQGKYEQEE